MTNFFKNKQLPKISKIAPQALKPQNLDEFGYFLAGLIGINCGWAKMLFFLKFRN